MRTLITSLFIVLTIAQAAIAQTKASPGKVFICVSAGAERYHSEKCNGLLNCTHTIKEVTKKEAKEIGRTPCKICYPEGDGSNPAVRSFSQGSSANGCITVQCSGTTQAGARCKNRTSNCSGRCHHHD